MYIDGVGVPMDFDKAKFWFARSGKSDQYAKQAVENKMNTLQPLYLELFRAHDSDGDGAIDRRDFQGFYRDCLMAKGLSRKKADEETTSPYQGVMKSDALFKDYDLNNDYKVSFDEIWALRGKISTLIPRTEKHFLAATHFFAKWKEAMSRAQESTGRPVAQHAPPPQAYGFGPAPQPQFAGARGPVGDSPRRAPPPLLQMPTFHRPTSMPDAAPPAEMRKATSARRGQF
jgi:hypothetical protein